MGKQELSRPFRGESDGIYLRPKGAFLCSLQGETKKAPAWKEWKCMEMFEVYFGKKDGLT